MIPDTEEMADALPVPAFTEICPKCDNPKLGYMVTLRLQYCPCCHTWLRHSKGSHSKAEHSE
jgi:hypothetical protein